MPQHQGKLITNSWFFNTTPFHCIYHPSILDCVFSIPPLFHLLRNDIFPLLSICCTHDSMTRMWVISEVWFERLKGTSNLVVLGAVLFFIFSFRAFFFPRVLWFVARNDRLEFRIFVAYLSFYDVFPPPLTSALKGERKVSLCLSSPKLRNCLDTVIISLRRFFLPFLSFWMVSGKDKQISEDE